MTSIAQRTEQHRNRLSENRKNSFAGRPGSSLSVFIGFEDCVEQRVLYASLGQQRRPNDGGWSTHTQPSIQKTRQRRRHCGDRELGKTATERRLVERTGKSASSSKRTGSEVVGILLHKLGMWTDFEEHSSDSWKDFIAS